MSKGEVTRLAENLKRYLTVYELDSLGSKMGSSLKGKKDEKALLLSELLLDSGVERRRRYEDRDNQPVFTFSMKGSGSYPISTFNYNAIKDEEVRDILNTITTSYPQMTAQPFNNGYVITYNYPNSIIVYLDYETYSNSSSYPLKFVNRFQIYKGDGEQIFFVSNAKPDQDIQSDKTLPLSGIGTFSGDLSQNYTFTLKSLS